MARYFDGVDDYIAVSAKLFSFPMTILCWYKLNELVTCHMVYSGVESSGNGWGAENETHLSIWAEAGNPNGLSFFSKTEGTEHVRIYTTVGYNTEWNFTAVVFDTTTKVYCNGILVASAGINGTPNFASYPAITYIGRPYAQVRLFSGLIAEVRIYNRALSEEEIKIAMYTRHEPRSGLVFYAPLWERSGNILDYALGRIGTNYGSVYADDPPMLNRRFVR